MRNIFYDLSEGNIEMQKEMIKGYTQIKERHDKLIMNGSQNKHQAHDGENVENVYMTALESGGRKITPSTSSQPAGKQRERQAQKYRRQGRMCILWGAW